MKHQCSTEGRRAQPEASILVVEDNALIRHMTTSFLAFEGFRVIEAGNVDEALSCLQADASCIDLVFSDIQMPGKLDGRDLARWVRDQRPDMPVILTSGRVRDDALSGDLAEFGPIETKPYRGDKLLSRLRGTLARRKPTKRRQMLS